MDLYWPHLTALEAAPLCQRKISVGCFGCFWGTGHLLKTQGWEEGDGFPLPPQAARLGVLSSIAAPLCLAVTALWTCVSQWDICHSEHNTATLSPLPSFVPGLEGWWLLTCPSLWAHSVLSHPSISIPGQVMQELLSVQPGCWISDCCSLHKLLMHIMICAGDALPCSMSQLLPAVCETQPLPSLGIRAGLFSPVQKEK